MISGEEGGGGVGFEWKKERLITGEERSRSLKLFSTNRKGFLLLQTTAVCSNYFLWGCHKSEINWLCHTIIILSDSAIIHNTKKLIPVTKRSHL